MAIKILIGGSPCTYWSIAQKNNRETEASGMGWELFKNYLIALEKFKPDYFLYENNRSAAQAIKDQIATELGVGADPAVRFTYINSALVSAQNRQRFYVTNFGDIEQPEDRGILLKDVLETGDGFGAMGEKGFALTATYGKGDAPDRILEKHQRTMVAEPIYMRYERGEMAKRLRKQYEAGEVTHGFREHSELHPRTDGKTNTLLTVLKDNPILEPVRIPEYGTPDKARPLNAHYSNNCGGFVHRMFSPDPAKQQVDMIAVPLNTTSEGKSQTIKAQYQQTSPANILGYTSTYGASGVAEVVGYATPVEWDENGTPTKAVSIGDGKTYTVYEVKDGQITIKGKTYPINLPDGYYIIRKLTVTECARLQTMPDDYCKAVSDSQAYKAFGNGWTAEVIIHLLNHALKDVPRDEEIVVLSLSMTESPRVDIVLTRWVLPMSHTTRMRSTSTQSWLRRITTPTSSSTVTRLLFVRTIGNRHRPAPSGWTSC